MHPYEDIPLLGSCTRVHDVRGGNIWPYHMIKNQKLTVQKNFQKFSKILRRRFLWKTVKKMGKIQLLTQSSISHRVLPYVISWGSTLLNHGLGLAPDPRGGNLSPTQKWSFFKTFFPGKWLPCFIYHLKELIELILTMYRFWPFKGHLRSKRSN